MKNLLALLAITCACAGKLPETRYYQLAAPPATTKAGDLVIALDAFETDAGYDDERIVYRTSPYRLDYYQYHRWSAAPGVMVGNFLEQALERSGKFRTVIREVTDRTPLVVRGRVVAIEEIDNSKTSWVGRIVVELRLTDSTSGETLWAEQFEETEPLRVQTPDGLAEALSAAMTRIASKATPSIAQYATDRQARASAASVKR